MVLASTGSISFSQIRTEMGGTGAVSLSSYRANGTTKSRGVTGIPVSGAITFGNFRGKTAVPVVSGLIAKYSGDSWNGSTLVDETGGTYNSSSATGTITQATGLSNALKYIYGSTTSSITFPTSILPTTYTMFHIIRYNGTNKLRIIDGVGSSASVNWLSGFWAGGSGVAYHNGWITAQVNSHYDTWVLSTDQNSYYASNQIDRTISTTPTANAQLSINNGAWLEKSDWAFACMLVYNTTLSASDRTTVENYLRSLYGVPTVSYYNWYTAFTRVNSGYTMVQAGTDPNVQINMNSASTGGSTTSLYISGQKLQDYNQVVVDFGLYIGSANADGLSFYMGGTAVGNYEVGPSNSYSVGFQIYNGTTTPGIYLYNGSGTYLTRNTSVSLNNSNWKAVKIIYTKGTSNTWQVYYDGTSLITYSDANNATWLTSAGGYWGFGCRVGGLTGDYSVKNVSVSYKV